MYRGNRVKAVAGVVALTAGTLAATTLAAAPAQAAAGPGHWVQLSSGAGIRNYMEPSVHRFGRSLQVVWTQSAGTDAALRTRILMANGVPATATKTLLTWAALNEFPSVFRLGSQRVIVFSGQQDTNSANPYSAGDNYYLTSSTGSTWNLASGTIGKGSAYASYGSDATAAGSTPLAVYTNGSANDISYNSGFDPLSPPGADPHTTPSGPFAYYAGVGYDALAQRAWTAWYSNSGKPATDGINAQPIYPTLGARLHAPGSTVIQGSSASSADPSQRVSVAARFGGGLYTAYRVGYPTPTKVALWRLGSTKALMLHDARGVAHPGVTAAPGGRLWVYWWEPGTSTLRAVRTNRSGTRFGRTCSVRTPRSTTDVWSIAGDGSNGRLDLVVNAGDGSQEQMYSTQVLPCLSARVSPHKISRATGGKVTVRITDAGVPVAHARVTYNGITKKTNRKGRVSFTVAKGAKKGKHSIRYRHAGYARGRITFRVKA